MYLLFTYVLQCSRNNLYQETSLPALRTATCNDELTFGTSLDIKIRGRISSLTVIRTESVTFYELES